PVVIINGDVDLTTGNINFNGTVHITGSVRPGFKVQADSDVIIERDVEDAHIIAGGNITIKNGVVGNESVHITARGDITARFIQNARIEAGKSITVED